MEKNIHPEVVRSWLTSQAELDAWQVVGAKHGIKVTKVILAGEEYPGESSQPEKVEEGHVFIQLTSYRSNWADAWQDVHAYTLAQRTAQTDPTS